MSDSATTLSEAMDALAGAHLDGEDHPSPDELWAYHAGELSGEDRERLQNHLAWCSECTRTVLDLAAGPEVELRDESLARTQEEEKTGWEALRQNLELGDVAGDEAQPIPMPVIPARRPDPRVRLLAAALAAAVLGFSFWVLQLTRQVERLRGPKANVFVADLLSIDAPDVRGSDGVRATTVPPGMETVVFLLVLDDVHPFKEHEAEVFDADDRLVWNLRGLTRTPEGGFSLEVPMGSLPSELLEIRLFGVSDGARTLLSTYRTRIERGASP